MRNNIIPKYLKFTSTLTTCLLIFQLGISQNVEQIKEAKIKPFIAYEFGEAAFNKFQSVSGEIGIRFPNNQMIRLVHMNVQLTEQHLSSSFAGAVDGDNVEGSMFGFEAFYDIPVTWNTLYLSPSVGYFKGEYNHLILDESLKLDYAYSVGLAVSYRENNLFGLEGLYYNFSVPMRFNLSPTDATVLGETTIVNNTFENNIWIFIGYEF